MQRAFVINTFSYIWSRPALACIAHLADAGHAAFEILLTAPHLWPADCDGAARRALVRLLQDRGASIVSLNAGGFDNNLASPAGNVRAFACRYIRDCIDLAGELGAASVVVAPGLGRGLLPPARAEMLGWFRDSLAGCIEHARASGVRLLVENVPFAFLPRVDQIFDAIDDLPREQLGIVFDVANAAFAREDVVAGLQYAGRRIDLVHLSDTPADVWRHDAVGRGIVPFERFGAALASAQCDVPLVLEIATDNPDRDIADSIAALRAIGY